MDAQCGEALKELEAAGLADDTIVFYYGDHGSGMPRSKRWPYNSGLHVPLIVHIPEKWRHLATDDYQPGGKCARLTSFVDMAPTLLSLIGADIPDHMQGHAFLGPKATKPQPYIYGFRGRMDERYDMVRTITDGRYVYIRNFMPHRTYGQYISYMFQTPTTRVWKEMYDAGELNAAQSTFWEPKRAEELYDLVNDPDEVMNLAYDQDYTDIRKELSEKLSHHMSKILDLGFVPEYRNATYGGPKSPYDRVRKYGRYSASTFDGAAEAVLSQDASPGMIAAYLEESGRFSPYEDVALYWGATGALVQGGDCFEANREALRKVATEEISESGSGIAKIVAAEALGTHGNKDDVKLAIDVLIKHADLNSNDVYTAMMALNSLDYLDEKAAPVKDQIAALPQQHSSVNGRMKAYIKNLINKTLADLE